MEEARIALFSKWSSAVLAWNREETGSGYQRPSSTFYTQVLVCIGSPGFDSYLHLMLIVQVWQVLLYQWLDG